MNIFSLEDLIFSFLRVDPKFYFINFFIFLFFFACFLSKQKNSVDFMAVMIVLMRMVVVFSRASSFIKSIAASLYFKLLSFVKHPILRSIM